jgi:hypothetical protein
MLGVLEIKSASRVPGRPLIAVRRKSTRILNHARAVQQVPSHERGIAIGKIIFRSAGAFVEIRRSGPSLAESSGIGLRRNDAT